MAALAATAGGGDAPGVPIREVCAALECAYGNPRLGNQDDPLDELVYIILSTRTSERTYRAIYQRLKEAYPEWDAIESGDLPRIQAILAPGGFARLKARQIVAIMERLRATFGWASLDALAAMPTDEAERFLVSLPGVAAKIAKCVLMYSLGRPVLPVDVHVHRVAARLGLRVKKRPDTSQDLIEEAIPPELRYGFHVNAIAHGRTTCLPRIPQCEACCVSAWCCWYHCRRVDDSVDNRDTVPGGPEPARG